MEKTFEERLYEHFIYTNQLYNFRLDLESRIQDDLEDNVRITCPNYSKGKYAEIKVECDSDFEDELAEFIEQTFTYGQDSEYFSALGYEWDGENHLLKIWIEI